VAGTVLLDYLALYVGHTLEEWVLMQQLDAAGRPRSHVVSQMLKS